MARQLFQWQIQVGPRATALAFPINMLADSSRPPNLVAACDHVSRAVCVLLCVGGTNLVM